METPHMIRSSLAVALVALPGIAAAGNVQFSAQPGGQIAFVMPSGNIGCTYTPAGGAPHYIPADGGPELSCDRIEPVYLRFVLGRAGPAVRIENVGDPGCCAAENAFAYGARWEFDGYYCESEKTGLTCLRGANGFFISRKETTVW
jgi:hypothetical protein